MKTFGDRLRAEREKKGYNQKEFAELIGVTPTRLNYWEKNKREPDFFNVKKIIDALECDADYLLGTQLSTSPSDSARQRIVDMVSTIDDRHLDAVQSFLAFLISKKDSDL